MTGWQRARTVLNWVNLTTLVGLLIGFAGRARLRRGPGGLLIAAEYRLPVPKQTCMTVGSVVVCRRPADWLLAERHATLLGHEDRHASQYGVVGLLFLPLYGLASAWSWMLTGSHGARNFFERNAGLDAGGYADQPLRGWAAWVARGFARRTPPVQP